MIFYVNILYIKGNNLQFGFQFFGSPANEVIIKLQNLYEMSRKTYAIRMTYFAQFAINTRYIYTLYIHININPRSLGQAIKRLNQLHSYIF